MSTLSPVFSVGQNVRFTEAGWQKACTSIDPLSWLVQELGRGPHPVESVDGQIARLDVPDFKHLPIPAGILEAVA